MTNVKIDFQQRITEFEIQADLYDKLKRLKFSVRAEIQAKAWNGFCDKRCKFDLVVFEKSKPILIIEVKRGKENQKWIKYKQFEKYGLFGVPVVYFFSNSNFNKIIRILDKLYEKRDKNATT